MKIIKKSLILLFLTVLSGIFFNLSLAHAAWYDDWDDFTDLFSLEEQGLTFTQYEGKLAELSPEGFDSALVASTDAKEFVIKLVNYALSFLGLLAVLIVIYGGVLYVTAGGEDEKAGKGKKAITYAAIGLIIVMGSFAFVNTIIEGGTSGKEGGGGGETVIASGNSFNASSEVVRAMALKVLNGFKFLAESTQDLKNIKNDAEKDSLKPENLPSKNDVLNFLFSVQEKLVNMRSKMEKFSKAETAVNELLRGLDKDIDTINALSEEVYVVVQGEITQGDIDYCDPEAKRKEYIEKNEIPSGLEKYIYKNKYNSLTESYESVKVPVEEVINKASDLEICSAGDVKVYTYIKGLYEKWSEIRKEFITGSSGQGKNELNLYSIINPIAEDYATELEEIFVALDTIYTDFSNIQAVSQGKAKEAYENMKSSSGYGYNITSSSGSKPKASEVSGGLLDKVKSWNLDSSIDNAGPKAIYGLKQQSIVFNELANLKYVKAVLSAKPISGPAPLIVNFDTIGSLDPAGGSLLKDNITWDIGGTNTTVEFLNDTENKGKTIPPMDPEAISCTLQSINTKSEADKLIGNTSKRCIFHKPGTYTAAIKIDSNEPTKYAPGLSSLTIKVAAPDTKIELKVTAGGETQTVMDWSNDMLITDKQSIKITQNDGESGVTFDATGTEDVEQWKWDFGNGEIEDFGNGQMIMEDIKYSKPGKYEVILEVLNILGSKDKKIFTMEVSSIVARINAIPSSNVQINTTTTFDGSGSKSDIGKITNYEWTIDYDKNQQLSSALILELNKTYPFTDSGGNLKSIKHTFKHPLKYDIKLKVIDDTGKKAETTLEDYRVESQPPVAAFDYQIPDKTQPGTVQFDGSKSFDPDATKDFTFKWSIEPKTGWEAPDLTVKKPKVKFKTKGEYEVSLKVTDPVSFDEFSEITKTIKIDNVLDIAWDPKQEVTSVLDEEGKAKIEFELISDNAKTFEIDFGDGEVDSGEFSDDIVHEYKSVGKYKVKVTVYDIEDNQNSIEKNIFIGGGDEPIAKINLFINGEEVLDVSEEIKVSKKDVLTFDASASKNTDGTDKNLKYSWNFGDEKISSKAKIVHSYKEISPENEAYTVILTVIDKDDSDLSAEDEIEVAVVNIPPKFTSIQGVPQTGKLFTGLITPATINMKAYGDDDADGNIIKYKWWYFDVKNTDEQLGIQITTGNSAQLMIGTKGKEGEEMTYGFGLEITDNDGLTYSNEEVIENEDFSKVTVKNGPNKLPTAKFTVSQTSIFVGDTLSFSSASTDPDGQIISYIWDLEGDGFFNNEPTEDSSIEYKYEQMNKDGYPVRLKVIDDKAGEAISPPVKIYVDSVAKAPVADFEYEAVKGSGGMKVKFINKSTADELADAKIITNHWDFDTESNLETADSDLDGKKDNDINSNDKDPSRLYTKAGTYKVKLTVTDDHGTKDDVVKTLKLPLPVPVEPKKETTSSSQGSNKSTETTAKKELSAVLITNPVPSTDGIVYLSGNIGMLKFDFSKSLGEISEFTIDKNIYFDTDGNGNKADDVDFKTSLPGTWTTNFDKSWGQIVVRLTVKDINNKSHTTTQEIKFNS